MSILIKGMKMPTNCKDCLFNICGLCLINWNIEAKYTVTHSCPLVELPPHGDLIDKQVADELNKKDYEAMGSDRYTDYARSVVLNCLNAAPTIIEAEGDEP